MKNTITQLEIQSLFDYLLHGTKRLDRDLHEGVIFFLFKVFIKVNNYDELPMYISWIFLFSCLCAFIRKLVYNCREGQQVSQRISLFGGISKVNLPFPDMWLMFPFVQPTKNKKKKIVLGFTFYKFLHHLFILFTIIYSTITQYITPFLYLMDW